MQSAKEKISNTASAAKEQVDIYKAKVEEKAEKAAARTKEEKKIAEERRKAKVAEAKMELHEAKARHASQKLSHKQGHLHHPHHHTPAPPLVGGTAEPVVGTHGHLHHHDHHAHHTAPLAEPVVGTHGHGHHHQPVGTANTMAGAAAPTYPLGPQYPATKYL